MKKSIERFKVRIDQNLNRTEKSEALCPELIKIEETIGVYKQVCTVLQKKLTEGLQGFGKGNAVERRLKKTGDFLMGQTLEEVGRSLLKHREVSTFAQLLVEMSGLCNGLACNQVHFEINVENIIIKLQEILNVDLPNILTSRKQLDRLILELDTAKARLEKAREDEQHGTPGVGARLERLVEDLDDTHRKVEQARDNLAADMLVFLSRDNELTALVAQYLDLRLKLHKDNTSQFMMLSPKFLEIRSSRRGFPIFGTDLQNHIESFGMENGVAFPLQLCVSKLINLGLEEEGLFRLAAGSSKIKRAKAIIDSGEVGLLNLDQNDHHVWTAVMKLYLRELPSPLMGEKLYEDWVEAGNLQGVDRFDAIWNLLQSEHLPRDNYKNIHYLFKFLHEVTLHSDKNKMTAKNLAIVVTPNVIWSNETVQDVLDVGAGGVLAQVVELIISEQSWFFQNDPNIEWNSKLPTLGPCTPVTIEESFKFDDNSTIFAGLACAINIPVSITSSPTPANREKNKKNKKAPAPPPSYSPGPHGGPSHSPNNTDLATSTVLQPAQPTSGSNSPVVMRKQSCRGVMIDNQLVHRSKSVEHRPPTVPHPSQPPPKPPVPTTAAVRKSMEPQLSPARQIMGGDTTMPGTPRPRAATAGGSSSNSSQGSSNSNASTPNRTRPSNSPSLSASTGAMSSTISSREDSSGAAKDCKDSSHSDSSDTDNAHYQSPRRDESGRYACNNSPRRAPAEEVGQGQQNNETTATAPGEQSQQASLYPDLSQLGQNEPPALPRSTNSPDSERTFPVPAPRFSKPALPSKPEGLTRNMSIRTSGGEQKDKPRDTTKL